MASDMNYFEIGTPDREASKAFYGALFDWRFGEPSMPARYAMINENRGGLCFGVGAPDAARRCLTHDICHG